jgi:hypothetical protein
VPTFRDSLSSTVTGSATLTVTKPSGVVNGDYMIVAILVSSDARTVSTIPSGWAWDALGSHAPTAQKMLVYGKTASGEGASWNWVFDSAVTDALAVCIAYSSVAATPFNIDSGANIQASSTTQPTDTITPTVDGCTVVGIYGTDTSESKYPATPDSSPAATERIEASNGAFQHLYLQDFTQTTAAAVVLEATFSNTAAQWLTYAQAIAPAAGGGGATPLRTTQSNLRW